MNGNNQIIIYQTEDGQTQVDVRMENDTVWLSANQMAMLFDRDEKTVRKHINNVFSDEELEKESNTQFLRLAHSDKPVAFYTLDVIISVGYRVKSQRGVKFRQWANRILKEYLTKGYAVNDRLRRDQLGELRQLVQVVGRTLQSQDVTATADGQALFDVVVDYTYALDTLDNYDYERLSIERTTSEEPFRATYENAMAEIRRLHDKFGGSQWFGNEKDDSFKSSIGQIYQTFGGEELYPSVEEKAAMQATSIPYPRLCAAVLYFFVFISVYIYSLSSTCNTICINLYLRILLCPIYILLARRIIYSRDRNTLSS